MLSLQFGKGRQGYLFLACKHDGITRAELARRLHWHREQVDRLFRFDHASKVEQLEAAFLALGREVVEVEVGELRVPVAA